MSYILDALRKAEAERRMGTTADAAAAPLFPASEPDRPARRFGSRWLRFALAAAAGALITVAWLEWRAMAPPPVQTAPVASTLPVTKPVSPAKPAAEPAAPVALHRPPPVSETPAVTAPPANPDRETTARALARQESAGRAQQPQQQSTASIATLRELPAEIQQQIPPFAINGYIYAADSADRSVLINRKLLHEGDEIAPGLTLEKLLPKGMVLNYKGYRYRSGY